MTKIDEATSPAVGSPVDRGVRPTPTLVERLRTQPTGDPYLHMMVHEAADEIERLRELADSEGTRAVEYLRRARNAEEELDHYRAQFLASY